jgi:hypothetical protein
MSTLKGVLIFSGYWFHQPWRLLHHQVPMIDLFPFVDGWLRKAHGKCARYRVSKNGYEFLIDKESPSALSYETGGTFVLQTENGTGVGTLDARVPLENALVWFSGRTVKVELGTDVFRITPDPSEGVFRVRFLDGSDSCDIPAGAEQFVCRANTQRQCVFFTVTGHNQTCEKFSLLGKVLLDQNISSGAPPECVRGCALYDDERDPYYR